MRAMTTRGGRLLGMAIGITAGLNLDYGCGNPNRERYEDWARRRGFGWSSMTRIEGAEAKRTRKAAKRVRDAERTLVGKRAAREDMRFRAIGAGSPWRLSAILAHPRWTDMEWCLHVYRRWMRRHHELRRADTRRDVREAQP